MRSMVIYYSLEGNCKFLADTIATELGAEIFEVKPVHKSNSIPYEKLKTIRNVIFGVKPQVEEADLDLGKFEQIFIGTPVRGRSFCPEIGGFLKKHRITGKKIAFFCAHGNAMGDVFGKMKNAMEGNCFIGQIAIEEPLKQDRDKVKTELIQWLNDLPRME